jgi:hypothetical protein
MMVKEDIAAQIFGLGFLVIMVVIVPLVVSYM